MADQSDSAAENKEVCLNRQKISFKPDTFVTFESKVYRFKEVINFDIALGIDVESGRTHTLQISKLQPLPIDDEALYAVASQEIEDISDDSWKEAMRRYEIIKPLLEIGSPSKLQIKERAKEVNRDHTTIYRWLKRYRSMETLTVLIPQKRGHQLGKTRLTDEQEAVIASVIKEVYLNSKQKVPKAHVYSELKTKCKIRNIPLPGMTALNYRIDQIDEKSYLRGTGKREKAKNKFEPIRGNFPGANYPLAVVQIDHTPVDLILVDDKYRKPIGRPWITLAIDVFSRMIVGYYLSFDPPCETSVAMCVAHAILPKDDWLRLHNVEGTWDAYGFMDKIHVDNGSDFRSETLKLACQIYGITLEFRPIRRPQYGGHIERLIRTLVSKIHTLPGTTYSNVKERDGYDSEKNAVLTFSEFEEWLVRFICNIYNERKHTGIGMSPRKQWEIGIFGNASVTGRGLPKIPSDPHTLLLDFLPFEQRTVQRDGVSINGIKYYGEVLNHWISMADSENEKKNRKFIFRIDPRDISEIWFFDPELKKYFQIHARNRLMPRISAYEHNKAKATLRSEGKDSSNEHVVVNATIDNRDLVDNASEKTKSARKAEQRRKIHEKKRTPVAPLKDLPVEPVVKKSSINTTDLDWDDDDIQPYDDLA